MISRMLVTQYPNWMSQILEIQQNDYVTSINVLFLDNTTISLAYIFQIFNFFNSNVSITRVICMLYFSNYAFLRIINGPLNQHLHVFKHILKTIWKKCLKFRIHIKLDVINISPSKNRQLEFIYFFFGY